MFDCLLFTSCLVQSLGFILTTHMLVHLSSVLARSMCVTLSCWTAHQRQLQTVVSSPFPYACTIGVLVIFAFWLFLPVSHLPIVFVSLLAFLVCLHAPTLASCMSQPLLLVTIVLELYFEMFACMIVCWFAYPTMHACCLSRMLACACSPCLCARDPSDISVPLYILDAPQSVHWQWRPHLVLAWLDYLYLTSGEHSSDASMFSCSCMWPDLSPATILKCFIAIYRQHSLWMRQEMAPQALKLMSNLLSPYVEYVFATVKSGIPWVFVCRSLTTSTPPFILCGRHVQLPCLYVPASCVPC